MSRLPSPISKQLRNEADDAATDRVWRGIQRRRAERARRGPAVRWSIGLVAAAAAVVALLLSRGHRSGTTDPGGALRLADGRETAASVQAEGAPRTVALSDGSRIDLGDGARLDLLENDGAAFSALLASGRATFDVVPGGPRRWTIECGIVAVEIVGTRFSVERLPRGARVVVERGIVLVRGERVRDRVQRLTAGESLEVLDRDAETAGTASGSASTEPPPAGASLVASSVPPRTSAPRATAAEASAVPGAPATPAWRDLARRDDNSGAYAALGPSGIASATQTASVDDLLALADVARLSGHPADAVAPLTRVMSEHSSDPRAPLAAFTLGRVQLDALGQPAQASAAFARAIALGLPQSLAEDAHARLVEARARAGDSAGARSAAQDYEQRYPQGKRLREVQRWAPD